MHLFHLVGHIIYRLFKKKKKNLSRISVLLSSRATAVAVAAFLDAFQKVADLATNSRGKNVYPDVWVQSLTIHTEKSSFSPEGPLLSQRAGGVKPVSSLVYDLWVQAPTC